MVNIEEAKGWAEDKWYEYTATRNGRILVGAATGFTAVFILSIIFCFGCRKRRVRTYTAPVISDEERQFRRLLECHETTPVAADKKKKQKKSSKSGSAGPEQPAWVYAWGNCAIEEDLDEDSDEWTIQRPRKRLVMPLQPQASVVVATESSMCAIVDGKVWSWGFSEDGSLGLGRVELAPHPTPVDGDFDSPVTHISAGSRHVVARTARGRVYAWGSNATGQLARTGVFRRLYPALVPLDAAAATVLAVHTSSFAAAEEGGVFCWGSAHKHILALDDGSSKPVLPDAVFEPVPIPEFESRRVGRLEVVQAEAQSAGAVPALILIAYEIGSRNLRPWIWGGSGTSAVISPRGLVLPPKMVVSTVAVFPEEPTCFLALCQTGTVFALGESLSGLLGLGSTERVSVATPVPMGGHRCVELAAGRRHVLAATLGGRVYAWGENSQGQLGLGLASSKDTPEKVTGAAIDDCSIQGVAAVGESSFALSTTGQLFVWGVDDLQVKVDASFASWGLSSRSLLPELVQTVHPIRAMAARSNPVPHLICYAGVPPAAVISSDAPQLPRPEPTGGRRIFALTGVQPVAATDTGIDGGSSPLPTSAPLPPLVPELNSPGTAANGAADFVPGERSCVPPGANGFSLPPGAGVGPGAGPGAGPGVAQGAVPGSAPKSGGGQPPTAGKAAPKGAPKAAPKVAPKAAPKSKAPPPKGPGALAKSAAKPELKRVSEPPAVPMRKLFWTSFIQGSPEMPTKKSCVWGDIRPIKLGIVEQELQKHFAQEAAPATKFAPKAGNDGADLKAELAALVIRAEDDTTPRLPDFSPGQKLRLPAMEQARRRNLAIAFKRLPPPQDLPLLVFNMDPAISDDQLEVLKHHHPSPQDMEVLSALAEKYPDNPWDMPEASLQALVQVPHSECRLQFWHLHRTCQAAVEDLTAAVNVVTSACKWLESDATVVRFLAVVLAVGNMMNKGTERGEAVAFSVEILPKLASVRGEVTGASLLAAVLRVLERDEKASPRRVMNAFRPLNSAARVVMSDVEAHLRRLQQEVQTCRQRLEAIAVRSSEEYPGNWGLVGDDPLLAQDKALADIIETVEDAEKRLKDAQQAYKEVMQSYCVKGLRPSDEWFAMWAEVSDSVATELSKGNTGKEMRPRMVRSSSVPMQVTPPRATRTSSVTPQRQQRTPMTRSRTTEYRTPSPDRPRRRPFTPLSAPGASMAPPAPATSII
mmetsp:Transcript_241/g.651  ORF Transcript_241/g.651 Transcript_241/m.651 type:complete len:1212 (-) Transcript_241:374-4009(-)